MNSIQARRTVLDRRTWFYLTATLLLLLFLLLSLGYDRGLEEWYWLTFAAPDLQRDLGFRTGTIKVVAGGGQTYELFAITYVDPGGAFARAGFRAGDVPSEWFMHGGAPAGFYPRLNVNRGGRPVSFVVVTPSGKSIQANQRRLWVRVPK